MTGLLQPDGGLEFSPIAALIGAGSLLFAVFSCTF
jgi:hypothetical protein